MTPEAHIAYLNRMVNELQQDKLRLMAENGRLRAELHRPTSQPTPLSDTVRQVGLDLIRSAPRRRSTRKA